MKLLEVTFAGNVSVGGGNTKSRAVAPEFSVSFDPESQMVSVRHRNSAKRVTMVHVSQCRELIFEDTSKATPGSKVASKK